MNRLIGDGVYKIRNGEYNRMVAALRDGIPHGPIVAQYARYWNKYDRWIITNVGDGGNQITIENTFRPGTYANPEGPDSDLLVGSDEETIWTVVKVDSGMYYLQNPEADRVWELPNGIEREDILLVPHTGQNNTKWTFDRVG